MNPLLDTTLQAVGLRKVSNDNLVRKALVGVDQLGRTNPVAWGMVGNGTVSWLSSEGNELTRNGYTNHGTAYSIVKYILDTAKPLPWAVYKLVDDEPQRLPSHPLYDLIYRPNPTQSWAELKEQVEGYLLTCGNAFIYAVRPQFGSQRGKKAELWALPAPLVEVIGGDWMSPATGYRVQKPDGQYQSYAAEDVLHLKFWNPENSRYGLSPIAAGIDAVTAAKAGLTAMVKQYQNAGPPGILSDSKATAPWTAEQSQSVRNWLRSFFSGGRRYGEMPITGGDIKYTQFGLSALDLQLLDAIPHHKDAVADLYHFPGQLLNGSKGTTFSNMTEAGKALYNRCVIPLETQFRDGLNRWLGPDYNDQAYIDFDTSAVPELQEDLGKLVDTLSKAWWMTTQDKQRRMGLPVDDTLPKYFIPAGLMDASATSTDPETRAEASQKFLEQLGITDYK